MALNRLSIKQILLIASLCSTSCEHRMYSSLKFADFNASGLSLKTNGYYYNPKKIKPEKPEVFPVFRYVYFYQDGSFFGDLFTIGFPGKEALNNYLTDTFSIKNMNQLVSGRGGVKVSNNSIFIRYVDYQQREIIYNLWGIVLNDTTYVITHREATQKCWFCPKYFKEPEIVSDTFRFQYSILKPDSTNRFIK